MDATLQWMELSRGQCLDPLLCAGVKTHCIAWSITLHMIDSRKVIVLLLMHGALMPMCRPYSVSQLVD